MNGKIRITVNLIKGLPKSTESEQGYASKIIKI